MTGFMMLSAFTIVSAVIWCLKNGCKLNRRGPEENICECDSCQAGELVCFALCEWAELGLIFARFVKAAPRQISKLLTSMILKYLFNCSQTKAKVLNRY